MPMNFMTSSVHCRWRSTAYLPGNSRWATLLLMITTRSAPSRSAVPEVAAFHTRHPPGFQRTRARSTGSVRAGPRLFRVARSRSCPAARPFLPLAVVLARPFGIFCKNSVVFASYTQALFSQNEVVAEAKETRRVSEKTAEGQKG
jgi:hypothetical protein